MKKKIEKKNCLNCIYGQARNNYCPKIVGEAYTGNICTGYVRQRFAFPEISIGEHGEYYYRDIDGSVSYA